MFEVGMKVVCLTSDWEDPLPGETNPVRGQNYVIRSVGLDSYGTIGLRFHWLNNPKRAADGWEVQFAAVNDGAPNFRPVIERKTSIEVFTRILRDASKEIEGV